MTKFCCQEFATLEVLPGYARAWLSNRFDVTDNPSIQINNVGGRKVPGFGTPKNYIRSSAARVVAFQVDGSVELGLI